MGTTRSLQTAAMGGSTWEWGNGKNARTSGASTNAIASWQPQTRPAILQSRMLDPKYMLLLRHLRKREQQKRQLSWVAVLQQFLCPCCRVLQSFLHHD